MAATKKAFELPLNLMHVVELMPENIAGKFIKRILEYVNGKPFSSKNRLVDIVFASTKIYIDNYFKSKQVGEYHWNWKEGITTENKEVRNSTRAKDWRLSVFSRDGYSCQHCGQKGGILHAHHIREFSKYPEFRFEISNGLTLCKNCHITVHKKNK